MENSVNLALETKRSRMSCKEVKKQDSWRYHMVSGFLAMVEMLHALRSLWEALFPFAMLWWNVMLCATCARYYSWNRSRFRLQWEGHQLYGEAMRKSAVKEIGAKDALPFYHSEKISHEELTVLTGCHSRSLTQSSCVHKMEPGSGLLQQSLPSTRELNDGMFLHDARVNAIVMSAKEHRHNQDKEFTLEDSILCTAPVSISLEVVPSGTSKLSFLHFPDERRTQQSGLLKAAYWAACPFLLPQQVAPLAMHRANGNFMDGTASVQLLSNIIIDFSTLEEHVQISAVSFVSIFLSMIHSKEHLYLAREIAKYLTSRGCTVYDNVKRLVLSSSLSDFNCTRSILSSEPLEGTMDRLGSETRKHPSSAHVSDFEPRSDVGLDNFEQDVSDDEGSFCSTLGQSYDGYSCKCVSGSESSDDLGNLFSDGNAVNSRQIDAGIAYPAYSQPAGEIGREMRCLPGSASQLNESHLFFYDRSADWDVKYGGSHLCQGVDSVYGGYYGTGDQVLSNYGYFTGDFESNDAVFGGYNFNDDTGVQGNSSKIKQLHQSDTWWDEDAVLVGNQEHEEDNMEQAWQVV